MTGNGRGIVKRIAIAVVGEFNPSNRSHAATNGAIDHCAAALGIPVQHRWIGTDQLEGPDEAGSLTEFGGLWIAPGSPYKRIEGALRAIRTAREREIPLLGTCGGFQHIVLEYARNVLGHADAEHEESNPQAQRLFVSRLACSLVGRTMTIRLAADSRLAAAYGCTEIREQYQCNYGVNPEYVKALGSGRLRMVASDEEGAVRAVELPGHPFFVGTLFLPQHISTRETPHPLISDFLRACGR